MPMVDTFTSHQLVRYAYFECGPVERLVLKECLDTDVSLKEELAVLEEAKRFLPKALFSAHPATIQKILDYSRNLAQ